MSKPTHLVCKRCGNRVTLVYVEWFCISQTFLRHIGNRFTAKSCGQKPLVDTEQITAAAPARPTKSGTGTTAAERPIKSL